MKSKKSKIWAYFQRDSAEVYVSLFKDPLHASIVATLLSILAIWYFWHGQQEWIEENGEPSSMKQRNIYIAISGTCLLTFVTISEIAKRTIKKRKRKKYFERIEREGLKPITNQKSK